MRQVIHSYLISLRYSFIIPCFNRPDEVHELLTSFSTMESIGQPFEILLVDGSPTEILKPVVEPFSGQLQVKHVHRPKLAISPSRNLGAKEAQGNFLIFLDSDVLLPPQYLVEVHRFLAANPADVFGGPDRALPNFTTVQKAINYAMTSLLTTGGIRGGKTRVGAFHPRGFNMGIRKEAFDKVGGYSDLTCGEDIDLSIRLIQAGFAAQLCPEAFVYHKRRATYKSFFRQVFRFGAARINLFQRHRSELKITHCFPAVFLAGLLVSVVGLVVWPSLGVWAVGAYGLYFVGLFLHSLFQNGPVVAVHSVWASLLQLTGYGSGFLANAWEVLVKGNLKGINLGASK